MTPWLAIVGIGEDGIQGLSARARDLVGTAALVVGGARHLALAEPLIRGEARPWPSPLHDAFPAILARRGTPVTVLASGDPNWFGIGPQLRALVPAAETLCLPAPSAFGLACARLGWAVQDVAALSACGRPLASVLPWLRPGARILLLSADETTPAALAALLREHGFAGAVLHILEALGGPRERVRRLHASEPVPPAINRLNLIGIEPGAGPAIARAPGLPDERFEHDGQITRREIRAMTLAALAPRGGETLWDIGCGSGSVGIEWSLAHPANRAFGIEQDAGRAERSRRNAAKLGAVALQVVVGTAPAALAGLPAPDAVFIGGGTRHGVLPAAWEALPAGGRLVVNAVTIQTQALLFEARARHGGTLTRMAVEHLVPVGDMHGFRPAMAVTQWAVEKP